MIKVRKLAYSQVLFKEKQKTLNNIEKKDNILLDNVVFKNSSEYGDHWLMTYIWRMGLCRFCAMRQYDMLLTDSMLSGKVSLHPWECDRLQNVAYVVVVDFDDILDEN